MRSRRSAYRLSLGISVTAFLLLFVCFLWFVTVIIPVMFVELHYQTRRVMRDVFHITSSRQLLPSITIRTDDTSRYATGGVSIPSIYVDEPVIYNVDPNDASSYSAALKFGIAHASGTALPGSGGLGYYFAHSSTLPFVRQYNAVFYLLGKLKQGDDVILWREGQRYPYVVTSTRITAPTEVGFLTRPYAKETVVLQTCWPPGTSLQRLLVFAEAR